MNSVKQIVKSMVILSEQEKHPDKVACLFSICMAVTLGIVEEMKIMREKELLNKI